MSTIFDRPASLSSILGRLTTDRHFLLPGPLDGGSGVGLAGLVVENINLGAGVVDNDQIRQAVAVEVGGMEERDLALERENFRACKTKGGFGVLALGCESQGRAAKSQESAWQNRSEFQHVLAKMPQARARRNVNPGLPAPKLALCDRPRPASLKIFQYQETRNFSSDRRTNQRDV